MTSNGSTHELLDKLTDRLEHPEDLELELKRARGGVPDSLWETVSAFANTVGGWIVLGIEETDDGIRIGGVSNPKRMVQQIHNQMRNPQKLSHPICGARDVSVEELGEEPVVLIRVPAASRRNKPVYINSNPYGGTFVRRNQGDFRCTKPEVDRMMREASEATVDSTVIPSLGLDALSPDAVAAYRQRFSTVRRGDVWEGYDDERFLSAIDATGADRETGREGLTVAGLLMLGRAGAIRQWRTRHLIDYRRQASNGATESRWEDRVTWEGNLLEGFEAIYPRLIEDQPVKFQLKDETRVESGPVQTALREALVNLLVHADYAESQASLIVRSEEGYIFRNPGNSRVPKKDLLSGDRSDPRNPILVRMFRLIGLAEEAGTGLAQIVSAWRNQGLQVPKIDPGSERYEFRLELRYSHLLSEDDRAWLGELEKEEWSEPEQLAMVVALHQGQVDNQSLRRLTGQHPADATKVLTGLRDGDFLERKGGGAGTYYELGSKAIGEDLQTEIEFESSQKSFSDRTGTFADKTESFPDRRASLADRNPELWRGLQEIAQPARENSRLNPGRMKKLIVDLCSSIPLSIREMAQLLDRSEGHVRNISRELIREDRLNYQHPESPRHPNQKYVART